MTFFSLADMRTNSFPSAANRWKYELLPRFGRVVGAVFAAALILVCMPQFAAAQLNAARLIGRSVANPEDPKYEDVASAITLFLDADFEGARKLLQDAAKKQPELGPADVMFAHLLIA